MLLNVKAHISDLSGMMGAGGGASPGPPGTGINLAALQSMLGGMGGGMPLIQPVANPEEAFASQLVQLQVQLSAQ